MEQQAAVAALAVAASVAAVWVISSPSSSAVAVAKAVGLARAYSLARCVLLRTSITLEEAYAGTRKTVTADTVVL